MGKYIPRVVPQEYSPEFLREELLRIATAMQPDAGIWTPEFWDDSLSNGESQTYSNQEGHWRIVGDLLWLWGRITLTSLGTLTNGNQARIGGLPRVPTSNVQHDNMAHIIFPYVTGVTIGSNTMLTGAIDYSEECIQIFKWTATGGPVNCTCSNISATGDLYFSGVYLIDT